MSSLTSIVRVLGVALVGASLACSDASIPTSPGNLARAGSGTAELNEEQEFEGHPDARGAFQRYVAIGTSVSMGFASDGVLAASQDQSWPAQLARMAHREMTLPLISGTGCQAPLASPLITFKRIDGSSVGLPRSALACAPNEDGVTLPTQNVAIAGATTQDALYTTPETTTDPNNGPMYPRVLASGQTQISAALGQNPKIVTVELGANEVLGSRNGTAVPGVSLYPVVLWAPLYTQLVNRVAEQAKYGLLVGLIRDVATFPGMRRGAELYADRAAFASAFHVTVNADCDASANLVFVPVRVPAAVAEGLGRRARGFPPANLSCAGHPSPIFEDYVLTPSEAAIINAQLAAMSAYIASEAARVGFAHAELEALYGRSDLKAPFSVMTLMMTDAPYGALVSLDGMHPNGAGSRIIAEAAAQALTERYGLRFQTAATLIASR
jgi:hypothetical protein